MEDRKESKGFDRDAQVIAHNRSFHFKNILGRFSCATSLTP